MVTTGREFTELQIFSLQPRLYQPRALVFYMYTYFHLPKDIFLIISITGLDCYFRSQVK